MSSPFATILFLVYNLFIWGFCRFQHCTDHITTGGWKGRGNQYIQLQGSRLRHPSMLNTRYFRFGREFQLSVRLSGHDFYVENISALEANFGWQEV